jgi:hypothetical protein
MDKHIRKVVRKLMDGLASETGMVRIYAYGYGSEVTAIPDRISIYWSNCDM